MTFAKYRSISKYFMSMADEELHYRCLEKNPTLAMHNKLYTLKQI